ncbi:hypothetical protein H0H87_008209 [Tephrocybe sp. NHM501043]|nr:hypothetical protein H0H87_008209 [Tephrocybe sp. NHM501043]
MADMDVDPPAKTSKKEEKDKEGGKQRFEVKKRITDNALTTVECSITLGMGYVESSHRGVEVEALMRAFKQISS